MRAAIAIGVLLLIPANPIPSRAEPLQKVRLDVGATFSRIEQQIKELGEAVLPVVDRSGNKKLVLNFENVRFMSSSFLGLLVKVH